MNRLNFRSLVLALAVSPLLAISALRAQEAPPAAPGPKPPAGAPAPTPDKSDKPDFPKFEEVCKDFEQVKPGDLDETGFLTLWYNKKTDQLFAQIPSALIGKQFLVAVSVAGGEFFTGFQLDHFIAYFERMDKELVIMRLDSRYARDEAQPVGDVVKRSYTDEILKSVTIRTLKGSDPVVDLADLFKGDFAGFFSMLRASVNPAQSKWATWKTFKENVEVSVDAATYGGGGFSIFGPPETGGPKIGRRMRMHYSFSSIPQSDYKPRVADSRVGYFLTARYDWGKKYDEKTLFNRYINRWNLQKRDPSLALSPPKQPIIWYIEKTVPIRWRRYVADGILEWNKAFEKCGFVNAVQVLQQDSDNQYARLDPEDVRYNFFRWIVTGLGFAAGPSRDHPLTGQIFDADIVFDDSMVRFYVTEYERMSGGGGGGTDANNPLVRAFFRAHPEWRHLSSWQRIVPNLRTWPDETEFLREQVMDYLARRGRPACDYSAEKGHQMALARIALEAGGLTPRSDEEFLGQIVKEVVMHEVGHCLGLRHNFKASIWRPMDEIVQSNSPDEATVASVMDYNPVCLVPRGQTQGSYAPRTIGPYDYWAIEYGYRTPGKDDKNEEEMLKKIASRGGEPGLAYGTDEDTFGWMSADPLSNRFDLGRDPTAYAERQIELINSLLADLLKWGVKEGESYSRLRSTFTRLVRERARVCYFVARLVGGQYIGRAHRGDPEERAPIRPVEPERQREAFKFVVKNLFARNAYRFEPDLLNHLAPGRYWHWNSDEWNWQQEFNVHDLVAEGQYNGLMVLMNPVNVTRIHDAELKFPGDVEPYALAEHIEGVTEAIWSELDGPRRGRGAFIHSYRRNLQRMHLRLLLNLVLAGESLVPADAVALARDAAAGLSEKIGALNLGDLDAASRAHLRDVKRRIDRALDAQYLFPGPGGGRRTSFFPEDHEADAVIDVLPRR